MPVGRICAGMNRLIVGGARQREKRALRRYRHGSVYMVEWRISILSISFLRNMCLAATSLAYAHNHNARIFVLRTSAFASCHSALPHRSHAHRRNLYRFTARHRLRAVSLKASAYHPYPAAKAKNGGNNGGGWRRNKARRKASKMKMAS